MTKAQLNTMIAALLDQSGKHCGSAAEQDIRFGANTWISHMSASMTLAGLAASFMAVRDQMIAEERPDAPREKKL